MSARWLMRPSSITCHSSAASSPIGSATEPSHSRTFRPAMSCDWFSADVGAAIVAYLRHGRPRSPSRHVFLRARAPIRGFLGQSAVGSLVRHTLERAGIEAPTKGAHQFRHALATQMLRHGASLTEIGAVLRHHSPETTKIYTKVDVDALRTLALPWPG